MKRTLIAACLAAGIVAFNAADAQAIAISFETTNIAGDIWQYSYSVTDFVFGANQALFIDFDSTLYSDLQESPQVSAAQGRDIDPRHGSHLPLLIPDALQCARSARRQHLVVAGVLGWRPD